MPFKNRSDAGRKLAKALAGYKEQQPVILALPRGGVTVAAEVAAVLNAPLDLILVRKVGVPFQPELAMGAVVDGGAPIIVRNEDVIRLADIDESDSRHLRQRAGRNRAAAPAVFGQPPTRRCQRPYRHRGRRWDRHRGNDPRSLARYPHTPSRKTRSRSPGGADGYCCGAAQRGRRGHLP